MLRVVPGNDILWGADAAAAVVTAHRCAVVHVVSVSVVGHVMPLKLLQRLKAGTSLFEIK